MHAKTVLVTALAVPLLVIACNRNDQPSPTASNPQDTQERQAQLPSSPERMMESAPPAAGTPPSSTTGSDTPMSDTPMSDSKPPLVAEPPVSSTSPQSESR